MTTQINLPPPPDPDMPGVRRRPTIEELETILNSEPKGRIDIKPDGSVYVADLEPGIDWPDPTPEMQATPEFAAVWEAIKTWDINVPGAYGGYCGATGNHVRAILDALEKSRE
jgi:hypothetical protein